ncbi:MAG: acetyl-CoA carboxylase biotin carboxyl carrier protein [Deferribacterota bacterium]|nr:acetyl-CoA carboxylase biotin carboxyl carrier protein [Deferribacterota bacterium]
MDIEELKSLIEFVNKLELDEFELENGDIRIYMSKNKFINTTSFDKGVVAEKIVEKEDSSKKLEEKTSAEEKKEKEDEEGYTIISPIIGTFYEAPAPGAKPFVKVGDIVRKGQTLCIIEAMKIMNELEAEFDCKILKRLVKNGEAVEFGQPLFIVEPLT